VETESRAPSAALKAAFRNPHFEIVREVCPPLAQGGASLQPGGGVCPLRMRLVIHIRNPCLSADAGGPGLSAAEAEKPKTIARSIHRCMAPPQPGRHHRGQIRDPQSEIGMCPRMSRLIPLDGPFQAEVGLPSSPGRCGNRQRGNRGGGCASGSRIMPALCDRGCREGPLRFLGGSGRTSDSGKLFLHRLRPPLEEDVDVHRIAHSSPRSRTPLSLSAVAVAPLASGSRRRGRPIGCGGGAARHRGDGG
jgi:hypothetical protein